MFEFIGVVTTIIIGAFVLMSMIGGAKENKKIGYELRQKEMELIVTKFISLSGLMNEEGDLNSPTYKKFKEQTAALIMVLVDKNHRRTF